MWNILLYFEQPIRYHYGQPESFDNRFKHLILITGNSNRIHEIFTEHNKLDGNGREFTS